MFGRVDGVESLGESDVLYWHIEELQLGVIPRLTVVDQELVVAQRKDGFLQIHNFFSVNSCSVFLSKADVSEMARTSGSRSIGVGWVRNGGAVEADRERKGGKGVVVM